MWQKRADTDAPLHKTFRDPTEKEARSNRKKNQNRHTAQKSLMCCGVFFLDFSNFKIKSQNNRSFSCVGCTICVLSFSFNLIQEEEDTI